MTAHYIHPMLYTCDGSRCKAEAEGTNARLPDGWWEKAGVLTATGSEKPITIHLCPKCSAPEASKP